MVVDTKSLTDGLDLLSANDHLTHSEVPILSFPIFQLLDLNLEASILNCLHNIILSTKCFHDEFNCHQNL